MLLHRPKVAVREVEKLFWTTQNQFFKNTDLIERSAIDEHSSVDSLKRPEILFRVVQK